MKPQNSSFRESTCQMRSERHLDVVLSLLKDSRISLHNITLCSILINAIAPRLNYSHPSNKAEKKQMYDVNAERSCPIPIQQRMRNASKPLSSPRFYERQTKFDTSCSQAMPFRSPMLGCCAMRSPPKRRRRFQDSRVKR